MADQSPVFTEEQLQSMTKSQLVLILKYYEIPYGTSYTKQRLIDLIPRDNDGSVPYPGAEPYIPKYSVRVQRLIDANGGRIP